MRKWIQALLRRFGYILVRNTRPKPLIGLHHPPDAAPAEFAEQLRPDHPRLNELRERYGRLRLPMVEHTWWTREYVASSIAMTHFRGDNAYIWQTRHLANAVEHRYFLYARDVAERDSLNLFQRLTEDGAFGCWTYRFHRFPTLSRDLLDSVNEINFLDRHLGLSRVPNLSVLDIGAGYGRLAYRSCAGLPNLETYFCTDAVPESTYLCEFYLRYRQCADKARVIPVDELQSLESKRITVALNVHSFSEMSLAAIEGWLGCVRDLAIPNLFIVPNDAESFLSMEADGTRRDFLPAIEAHGFRLAAKEPVIADPDVRELVGVDDHLFLFTRSDR